MMGQFHREEHKFGKVIKKDTVRTLLVIANRRRDPFSKINDKRSSSFGTKLLNADGTAHWDIKDTHGGLSDEHRRHS